MSCLVQRNDEYVHFLNFLFEFSETSGAIYVRRSDQRGVRKFSIDEVTPDILKDVFELESLPTFIMKESNEQALRIIPSSLIPNENYIVKGPGPEIRKKKSKKIKQGNRAGM